MKSSSLVDTPLREESFCPSVKEQKLDQRLQTLSLSSAAASPFDPKIILEFARCAPRTIRPLLARGILQRSSERAEERESDSDVSVGR